MISSAAASACWRKGVAPLTAIVLVMCAAACAAEKAKPDFTGVWGLYVEPGKGPAIGGGVFFGQAPLPFTPEGTRRNAEYRQLLGPENANPGAYCVDYGMPMMMEMAGGYPIEFIHKPDQLTLIFEVEGETRRVYLGSRGIPEEKRMPTRQGYSVGHWEGDTLVVETDHLLDAEDQVHPHSDQARIVERISPGKAPDGTKLLAYAATLTDPIYYREPVKIEKTFALMKDGFIFTYRCPDEFWNALLVARRAQLRAAQPVSVRMSDVYKVREASE